MLEKYERLIEEIQAAVASTVELDLDLLRDTATEYATAVEEVNDRLIACGRLLKRGLRGEAIQQAELEPSLLDAFAILDVPEIRDWGQLMAEAEMPAPPPLRVDLSQELNAAYAAAEPLKNMLRLHRLMAVARAPLANRIVVMRRIAAADADNAMWHADLATFESTRQQQIARELKALIGTDRLEEAEELAAEVDSPDWFHPPEIGVRRDAAETLARIRERLGESTMAAIADELVECYRSHDLAGARELRERWRAWEEHAHLSPNHPTVRKAAGPLAWIAEEDENDRRREEHRACLDALTHALDTNAARGELERLMFAAERSGESIDDELLVRYAGRLREFEAADRRRFVVTLVGVLGVLALIGGGAWWTFEWTRFRGEVASRAKELDALLEDEDALDEAQAFRERLERERPEVMADGEMQKRLTSLETLVAAEENRRTLFDTAMRRVEESDPGSYPEAIFEEARTQAKTDDDHRRIAEWKSKVAAHDRAAKAKREEDFSAKVKSLAERIDASATLVGQWTEPTKTECDAMRDALKNHRHDWDELAAVRASVGAALAQSLDPIDTRIKAVDKRVASFDGEREALARATKAVGDPEAFREALTHFADSFPDSPDADDFRATVLHVESWRSAAAWKGFFESPETGQTKSLKPPAAAKAISQGQKLVDASTPIPATAAFLARRAAVQAVADRASEKSKEKIAELRGMLTSWYMRELHQVVVEDADASIKRFYTSEAAPENWQPEQAPDRVLTIKYRAGFEQTQAPKAKAFPSARIKTWARAPQRELAERMLASLAKAEAGAWESGFREMIVAILAKDQEADPVLRALVLKRTVAAARVGSRALADAMTSFDRELAAAAPDLNTLWIDPTNAAAKSAREEIAKTLTKLADLREFDDTAKRHFKSDTEPWPRQPTWIAWVQRHGERATLHGLRSNEFTGRLVALVPSAGAEYQWKEIGRTVEGKTTWSDSSVRSGTPVFVDSDANASR